MAAHAVHAATGSGSSVVGASGGSVADAYGSSRAGAAVPAAALGFYPLVRGLAGRTNLFRLFAREKGAYHTVHGDNAEALATQVHHCCSYVWLARYRVMARRAELFYDNLCDQLSFSPAARLSPAPLPAHSLVPGIQPTCIVFVTVVLVRGHWPLHCAAARKAAARCELGFHLCFLGCCTVLQDPVGGEAEQCPRHGQHKPEPQDAGRRAPVPAPGECAGVVRCSREPLAWLGEGPIARVGVMTSGNTATAAAGGSHTDVTRIVTFR